jgi:hypothetical protein
MLLDEFASALLARRPGEVVRGEPYVVGGRRLTPFARLRTFEAFGGRIRVESVRPVGFVEEIAESRRWIGLGTGWGEGPTRLVVAALPVLVFVVAAAVVRARRSGRQVRGR